MQVTMWKYQFIHTLGTIPKDWYLMEEKKRQTTDLDTIIDQFYKDFSFHGTYEKIFEALRAIKKGVIPVLG